MGGLTTAQQAFREEVATWLDENLVGDFRTLRGVGGPSDEARWDERVAWEIELSRGGWRGITWPTKYGGRGASVIDLLIFELEYARAGGPYRPSTQSEHLFAPTLIAHGTAAQRSRFLPRILTGDDFWAQGFSEPGAGSDLAGVSTVGTLDGDRWVINGRKCWTTFAQFSDWIYVLCRTDSNAERHRGLSFLLVPVDQQGVTVRPLRTMAGNEDFCEVTFKDATTDASMVVGEVGGGWAAAMSLLGFERGTTVLGHQLTFASEFSALVDAATEAGVRSHPVVRQRLAAAWIGLKLIQRRSMATIMAVAAGRPLGTEVSIGKLAATNWHQELANLNMDVLGARAMTVDVGYDDLSQPHRNFLLSRAETIYGGSNEIQHNIVGERGLGLPR